MNRRALVLSFSRIEHNIRLEIKPVKANADIPLAQNAVPHTPETRMDNQTLQTSSIRTRIHAVFFFQQKTAYELVVHAAALKQVPAAEFNPLEAIKTNI